MAENPQNLPQAPGVNPQPFMNVDKAEIELIKENFKDDDGNDYLLKAMRTLLFGFEATVEQKSMVRVAFSNEALMKIIRKRFLPRLDKDSNIGQVSDAWLGVETMIFGVPRDTIEQAIGYKDRAIDMTEEGLKLLKDPDRDQTSLDYNPKTVLADPLQINLLARNQYIRHIEQQLLFLKLIAAQVDEKKPKDIKEDRKKDSAR